MDKLESKQITWEDFATVKKWKQKLELNSIKGEFPENTWKSAKTWMPKYVKFSQKTPDELIEEALTDPEIAELSLRRFFNYLKKEGQQHNSARMGTYGVIQGFYSNNRIDTRKFKAPAEQIAEVVRTDSNYPVFVWDDERQKFKLNRPLLQGFLRKLNDRDETAALCMISSGDDVSDILKLTVGFVRNQDPRHKRLVKYDIRDKTGIAKISFYSKEATRKVRILVNTSRKDAKDNDPLFVNYESERRREFRMKNKRAFVEGIDELPPVKPLHRRSLETDFRIAAAKIGVTLERGKQSPLRPKRLRKIFRTACEMAGLSDDRTQSMMGHSKKTSSQGYLEQPREILERRYMAVEPIITVLTDPDDNEEIIKIQKENQKKVDRLEELERKQDQMQEQLNSFAELNQDLPMTLRKDPNTGKMNVESVNVDMDMFRAGGNEEKADILRKQREKENE